MARNSAETSLLDNVAGYTAILSADPGSPAFVSLCDAYRQMGLLDEALEVARRGTAARPQLVAGHLMLGRLLAERGDLVAAENSYEKAVELDTRNLTALKGLARVCFRRGDRERTRLLLEQASLLSPEDATVRQMLSFFSKSSPTAAVESTPAEKPGDPMATPTMAEIYLRQGLPGRALEVYRNLLLREPSNTEILRRIEELEERIRAEEETQASEFVGEEPIGAPVVDPSLPAPALGRLIEVLSLWAEAARRRRKHVS